MISYGQKTLNKNDVRNATIRFVLTFLLLAGLGFLSVFLFFKSSKMQAKNIQKELNEYHEMLGRNELLRMKTDSIFMKMTKLSQNKVDNDIFLRNSIIEDISTSRKFIGKDSADHLKHYMVLMENLQPMLALKNDLLKYNSEKAAVERNLQECISSSSRVQAKMSVQAAAAPRPEKKGRLFQNFKK